MNKKKIFNDPVYGFITIPNDLVYDIIEHPYFQRLRRIRQLGLSDYVYPGALHTRFHHALGAMHLMGRALDNLRAKGVMIFEAEYEAALIAILLHDVGHGPFSHTLEYSIFEDIHHEQVTSWVLQKLNNEFKGRLSMAIQIFEGKYPRRFLHQLVSSQLDVDRLDYLSRDSFFTGVQEGTIGSERIIKMLNVVNDELVVEEKGLYSIENFLGARRMMYWQVYLHKTAISAENMLNQLIQRVKKLLQGGHTIQSTPALDFFLKQTIRAHDFTQNPIVLEKFMQLDDTDIWGSIKFWADTDDQIIKILTKGLLERKLFKIYFLNEQPPKAQQEKAAQLIASYFDLEIKNAKKLVIKGNVSNAAYLAKGQSINILKKNGEVIDVAMAADLPNILAMSKEVKKYFLCVPKEINLSLT